MLPYSPSGVPAPNLFPGQNSQEPVHKRPAVVFGIILSVIILAGLIFGLYYFFFRGSAVQIDLRVQAPDSVLVGEPFSISVSYQNASDQVLRDASINVTVPEGVSIIGLEPSVRLGEQKLEDIPAQGLGSKVFRFIVTNDPQSIKSISVSLRYNPTDRANVLLEKNTTAQLSVAAPAVALNMELPQAIYAGQTFKINLDYRNNSQSNFSDARIVLDYPDGFHLASASTTLKNVENGWELLSLPPNAHDNIELQGSVDGLAQSFFNLNAHLQIRIEGYSYDLVNQSATVGISGAPLSISIAANNSSRYIASLGETLTYILTYKNNSRFSLQNVVIKANLDGDMFDWATVRTSATFDSVQNILVWNAINTPALASLPSGAAGTVRFVIGLRKSWPIENVSDKDFAVEVRGNIKSLTVPAGITATQTASDTTLNTKIMGQVALKTAVYFKDSVAGISNIGPYPPRVNQKTQYTVHWQIRNYSTDLKNVRVSAPLQSGALMVKSIQSNASTSPKYDSNKGEVSWDIPFVPAGQGILNEPLEAIFQIEQTPAINQSGTEIPLLGQTLLSATDAFTSSTLRQASIAKSSGLPDDTQAAAGDRRVKP